MEVLLPCLAAGGSFRCEASESDRSSPATAAAAAAAAVGFRHDINQRKRTLTSNKLTTISIGDTQ